MLLFLVPDCELNAIVLLLLVSPVMIFSEGLLWVASVWGLTACMVEFRLDVAVWKV